MGLNYKVAPKERKRSGLLPVLGLVFAFAIGAFAYGVAGPLVKYGQEHSERIDQAAFDLREQFENYDWYRNNQDIHANKIVEILTAAVLWFILMGFGMLIVSMALMGTDPEKDVWKNMGAPPANKKKMIKQMKRDLRKAKQQAREQKKHKPQPQ